MVRVYTVFFVFKFANENRITNSFFVFKLASERKTNSFFVSKFANEKRIPFSFFVFISDKTISFLHLGNFGHTVTSGNR